MTVNKNCKFLPGILDYFDAVDILALIVLVYVLTLASFGGLQLGQEMVQIIIYVCLLTLFGTKVVKGVSN